jgi:hypothetical protein
MMRAGSKGSQIPRRWIFVLWLLAIGSGWVVPLTSAPATTMYSYIDEQGTAVITDNLNTIPERYRAKVQTIEQKPKTSQETSTAGAIHERITNWGRELNDMASAAVPNISGLSPSQSQILTYAGVAAIILLVAMTVSKGQMIRLLALWCLIMLGLATPVLMYVSKDGPMDVMKHKAAQAEKQRQDRTNQMP